MSYGTFDGDVKTQWLKHAGRDRNMELLEDFAFVDPAGKRWEAPSGSVVNGASIPSFLWGTIGSPYVGDFRRASVLHDVACGQRTEPHQDVHWMFYNAMRADGVSEQKALSMYAAVALFGPKWASDGTPLSLLTTPDAAAAEAVSVETLQRSLQAFDEVLGSS